MTRMFPDSEMNSQRGPSRHQAGRFAKLWAAALMSSSLGLSAIPPAWAQSHNPSQEIRQVAGERSGGLLRGLFGRGAGDSGHSDEPYRKATPVPSDREVNWKGIPYHNPHDGLSQSTPPSPIHDPGARSAAAKSTGTAQSMSAQPRTSPSAAPTPPPIGSSTPRRLTPQMDSAANATISGSGRPAPLSVTQSSRRPPASSPNRNLRWRIWRALAPNSRPSPIQIRWPSM